MRVRFPLFVGALLASLALAGAATAVPTDDTSIDNTTDLPAERIGTATDAPGDTAVGICVVGAGGPCNGGNASDERPDRATPVKKHDSDGDVGICLVGAGGPCNGGQPGVSDGPADEESAMPGPFAPFDPFGFFGSFFSPVF
jgi:hypothetical protein